MPATPDKSPEYYLLALMHTKGIGATLMRRLLDAFGDAQTAANAAQAELAAHIPKDVAKRVCNREGEAAAEAALRWTQQSDENQLITAADEDYPQQLLHASGAPLVLYACGQKVSVLNSDIVAIVGSRSASVAGVRNAEVFARALSETGIVVASGMAQGIDAAAHEGAIAGGAGTIAVVGTGPDIIYPREHRKLAQCIRENGVIIGELPPGTPPDKHNFPPRNRIISGLARGCLVVEAGEKSGALITAKHSMENDREVFAVPGSINSPMHRGCHKLIKQGAKLTETVADIAEELNIERKVNGGAEINVGEVNGGAQTSEANAKLLECIGYEPTATDDIAGRSGLSAQTLMPALLELEMEGKIAAAGGGKYQRL